MSPVGVECEQETSFEIEDLFDLVFPDGACGQCAVIFHEFSLKYVVSGAVCGHKDQWVRFRHAWKARLAAEGMRYFKSSEYFGLRGEWAKFRGLEYPKPRGREAAQMLRADLEHIIENCGIKAMAVGIPVPVIREVGAMPEFAGKIPNNPYDWAMQSIFQESVKDLQKLRGHHQIAFVHDDGNDFSRLYEIYLAFKRKNPDYARNMAAFSALDDKLHPPIQAADMVANLMVNHALELERNPDLVVQRLTGSIVKLAMWNKEHTIAVLRAQSGDCPPTRRGLLGQLAKGIVPFLKSRKP